MTKHVARNINISLGGVAMERDVDDTEMSVDREQAVVTAFDDDGPRRRGGNYDHGLRLRGAADFAAGRSDATLFGMLGSDGVVSGYDPTGAAAAGPDDPHYDSQQVLSSYRISGSTGGAVTYEAQLMGNAALTRSV